MSSTELTKQSTPLPDSAQEDASLADDASYFAPGSAPTGLDLLILVASLVVMLWGLGNYGLYEPHEGHFAGIGREMLLSGDYVTPHLNGSPYLNKPPLLYWSVATSNALFGISEWSARLPGAIYGWLAVLLAWVWASRLWGRPAGRVAAPMVAVSVGWFMFTHQLMTDALISMLNFAALYAFWRCVCRPTSGRRWFVFWAILGLGLMAKGPLAVFPCLAAASFIILRKRWRLVRQSRFWWGIPLAFLPVVLWGILVELNNRGFLHHILVNEMWNRIFDKRWPPDYKVSQVSAVQYLIVTAIWCAPWTLLLPWSGAFASRGVKARERNWGEAWKRTRDRSDGVLLLVLGALWPVMLFLPIPSRLVYYCLPTVPPFAVLTAGWWITRYEVRMPGARRLLPASILGVLGLVALSAALWVTPLVKDIPDMRQAPDTIALIPQMALLLGGALFLGGLLLALKRPRAAVIAMLALMGFANMKAAEGLVVYQDIRTSKRMVGELDPLLRPDTIWISEGSFELGASAGIAYYLSPDEDDKPRFVKVMVDDERRVQPRFGNLPRHYALMRAGLQELWDDRAPVVFVTDMMRRDFESAEHAPRLPRGAGKPVGQWGFKHVYANAAAWERLKDSTFGNR